MRQTFSSWDANGNGTLPGFRQYHSTRCVQCPVPTDPLALPASQVVGLTPLVPIVPYMNASVHLQHRSLGGFTFAFTDYVEAGVLLRFDTPAFASLTGVVDPANYLPRLASIPKLAIVSSDDE